MRALVALDVTYAQGYGLARPGPPWPQAGRRPPPRARPRSAAGLRVAIAPRGVAGAFASRHGRALRRARRHELARRPRRLPRAAPPGILRADDVALMLVDRDADELKLLSEHPRTRAAPAGPSSDFPATRYVLDHRVPGQVVAGDAAGDPAELAELEALGMATAADRPDRLRRPRARRPRGLPRPAHRPSPPARSTAPACSRSNSARPSTASPKAAPRQAFGAVT